MKNVSLFVLFALAGTLACEGHPPASPTGHDQRSGDAGGARASHDEPASAVGAEARVLLLADALVDDHFAESPGAVAMLRPPGARYDDLPIDSLATTSERQAREDAWAGELASVDRAALDGTPAALAFDIARETLDARKQARVCRHELWAVRAMGGFQVSFADLAQAQPVGTPDARAQALRRFAKFPAYVKTQIENLREGLRLGYLQADVNVRQVLEQIERLTQGAPEASAYYSPAQRDADPDFRAQWKELVAKQITPALAAYGTFLRTDYLPRARKAPGVSANPDGAACYRAALRFSTTLPIEPTAVHHAGLEELARIETEMKAISVKSFGGAPLRALFQRFTHERAFLHKDAAAATAQANAAVARAQGVLPLVFGILPGASVVVEPIPRFQERTAAAHYLPAALDGSRPATYRIRLYEAEKQSIVLGESTAFHETVPGHHLQINIANERKENPRIARFLFNSGFAEGWALYAERLADELGLYSSDASRLGMLSNAAWRACRLIVDSGIHAFGWERQRAISLLLEHTAMPDSQAAQEVDRYISWPGQATSYMIGYLEIAKLRAEARTSQGAAFDLKAFHDRVLENGIVPLPVLRRRIERWSGAAGR